MGFNTESRLQIALKKLMGRAMTKDVGATGEAIPSNVQVSATTIFADQVPDIPFFYHGILEPFMY